MITFQNTGLVDLRALTTFGVSAKENDRAIGFFGTGFKYAVAIVLRLGGSMVVYVGTDKYEFGVENASIRDRAFGIVTMNGKPLGFTTHLGTNWEPWQAFRELACNAMDEGDHIVTDKAVGAREGTTTVVVDCREIDAAYEKRDQIFLSGTPKYTEKGFEVHSGDGLHVYYQGVRVGDHRHESLFNYNMIEHLRLTEDRTIAYDFQVSERIANGVLKSDNDDFVKSVVTAPRDTFEQKLDLYSTSLVGGPSEAFMRVMDKLPHKDITNIRAIDTFRHYSGRAIMPTEHPLTRIEEKQLSKAVAFLDKIGQRPDMDLVYVSDDLPRDRLGMVYMERMYLSRRVFQQGTKQVAATLLEEWLHLSKGYRDETYEFQTFLFDLIISVGEQIMDEPL